MGRLSTTECTYLPTYPDSRRYIDNQKGRLKNYGNIMIKETLLIPDILIYKSQLAAPRY